MIFIYKPRSFYKGPNSINDKMQIRFCALTWISKWTQLQFIFGTNPVSIVPLFTLFSKLLKHYWISRSYLAGVVTPVKFERGRRINQEAQVTIYFWHSLLSRSTSHCAILYTIYLTSIVQIALILFVSIKWQLLKLRLIISIYLDVHNTIIGQGLNR